jgi:hypothetical protein
MTAMMKKIAFLLCLFWMVLPAGWAADKPVWVIADGEAWQGELDTLKEVKERAWRHAQRRAVEEAVGTFIRSHTLVSNSQVAEDLIYAAVRGKIVKEEVVSSEWDKAQRHLYRVRLKALVEPMYPEKGGGLWAKLTLSKAAVTQGEEVEIFYTVSEDAYVYLFSIAADGSVTLLLPNAAMPDHFTKAGKAHRFPPPGSGIQLKAVFLPNSKATSVEERIKLVATRKKEPLLALGFKEGMFQVYDEKSTGMINDLVRRLSLLDVSDWTEASAVYWLKRP